jgi:tRNA dimethylallyltransferase
MIRLSDHQLTFRPLIALVGPTAVGKSEVGVRVARALGTEVLTADSRQVYRGMDIATDKPAVAARRGIPHRLINLVNPDQRFNAGMYQQAARREIERLYGQQKIPLVVGGTGLYVRTLIRGLCEAPPGDPLIREDLLAEAGRHGKGYLHRQLALVDPELARGLHPHDEVKIIRALEVQRLSGRAMSEAHRLHRLSVPSFTPLLLGLMRPREVLYRRIDQRVEGFFQHGLIEETRRLLADGYSRDLPSMKGLGYRQVAGFILGDYDEAEAMRQLKRDTRHFAKRQLTWFRREPGLMWVMVKDDDSPDLVAQTVASSIQTFLDGLTASPAKDVVAAPC